MPKPRIIDPAFWEDLDIIALTRDERLLLVSIFTAGADDQGLSKANAPYLKRLAFAFDADISIDDVERMILHIGETCRNVLFYYAHDERYLGIRNWRKYQNIRYARKTSLPMPPWAVDDDVWPASANFDKTAATLAKPLLSSVGLGSAELGRVEEDGDCGDAPPPSEPPPLAFDTPGSRMLQARLKANAVSKGHRGPRRFRTLEQKRKFLDAEQRLGPENIEIGIDKALGQGINSLGRLVNWLAKYDPGWKGARARASPSETNSDLDEWAERVDGGGT